MIGVQARSAGLSHVGMVRTVNQDAWLDRADIGLWAVADGMGGHASGEAASLAIVHELGRLDAAEDAHALLKAVERAIEAAQRRLTDSSVAGETIGSTVAALLVHGDSYAVVWAGDSRVYLLRDGELRQLTRDHSLVQDLIERGDLAAEQARTHPLRNRITRAVANDLPLELERLQSVLKPNDVFLLCSDGLTAEVQEVAIREQLVGTAPSEAVKRLVNAALDAGASDNVTAVVVAIGGEEDRTQPILRPGPAARR